MRESAMALALAGFSFMLTVIWGEPLLRILRHLKIGESIRVDGPQGHISKLGTPTMGGVLFILPVLLITLLLNAASLLGLTLLGRSIFLPIGTMIVFGLLGGLDDWKKLRGKNKEERGMSGTHQVHYPDHLWHHHSIGLAICASSSPKFTFHGWKLIFHLVFGIFLLQHF